MSAKNRWIGRGRLFGFLIWTAGLGPVRLRASDPVGAGFLTGFSDFLVTDMGGTTTDCAVVRGGKPAINAEGALIGGWRTMVEAVDVRTVGLGGTA